MEAKIILCDKCKKAVANITCKVCENDVCSACYQELPFQFGYNDATLTKLPICFECRKVITKMLNDGNYDKTMYDELITKFLKDNIIIRELKETKQH